MNHLMYCSICCSIESLQQGCSCQSTVRPGLCLLPCQRYMHPLDTTHSRVNTASRKPSIFVTPYLRMGALQKNLYDSFNDHVRRGQTKIVYIVHLLAQRSYKSTEHVRSYCESCHIMYACDRLKDTRAWQELF